MNLANTSMLYWSPRPAIAPAQSHVLETRTLTNKELHASIAPVALITNYRSKHIFFDWIGPEVNILAALCVALDALIPEQGVLKIHFSEAQHRPRLPAWRDYWRSIAKRLGFELLQSEFDHITLVKSATEPRWALKLADESDIEAIKELFKHVFQSDMSDALWHWKYGDGRGNAVLAYRDGVLVAHYGGMFREIILNGESEWALQAGDVMVHPAERGVFTRHGAFFLMTATWAEMYGSLNFGFPASRAMRLGERLGIYKKAGSIYELRWPTQGAKKLSWSKHISPILKADARMQHQVNKLWQAMLENMHDSAIGVRDWNWLEHRYLQRPTREYQIFAIRSRWTRVLQGIFVVLKHDDAYELMDMICAKNHIPLLIQSVRRLALDLGASSIFTWITKNHLETLNYDAPAQNDLDIEIPSDAWTGSPDASEIIDRWWLMPGDTDFR